MYLAEMFNILNHANFSVPAAVVYTGAQNVETPIASAGLITSTLHTSRQIQLAFKDYLLGRGSAKPAGSTGSN